MDLPSEPMQLRLDHLDPLEHWQVFAEAVHKRLLKGKEHYGNCGFERSLRELVAEIDEEVLDVCGWAFLLWYRIAALRKQLLTPGASNCSADLATDAAPVQERQEDENNNGDQDRSISPPEGRPMK